MNQDQASRQNQSHAETPFLGLAPFLRKSIAGADLRPICQQMLARAEREPNNANLWMNLSIALFCLGLRDTGMAIQAQALALARIYHLAAAEQPARLRLLLLMAPGDLAANTPIECLLEQCDIDLTFYFVSSGAPLAETIPEHDVLMVSLSESEENRALLVALEPALSNWPKPIVNAPQHIPATGRIAASVLLQDAPGLLIPPTLSASRSDLLAMAQGSLRLPERFDGCDFPIIVRPIDSHGGHGLEKLNGAGDIAGYLAKVDAEGFFLSRFIDYSGQDGLFRKFRIALVDGKPYACHLAVSSNWMIHYLNANMYEDAQKREEEAAYMACFAELARRHQPALDAIYRRTKLDYVCIDAAETPDGRLLVFEIDHAMVVHAMDPVDLFPYKQRHMQKVQNAFRDYLLGLAAMQRQVKPIRACA